MADETENGYAEGWRPEKGDNVKGVVTQIDATDGGYGVYPVVTLRREDGSEIAVHAYHTVLRRELASRRPGPGDALDITYLGKKSEGGRGDRGYDIYRVKSSKDPEGYNWDQDLPEEQRGGVATAEPPIAPSEPPAPAEDDPAPGALPDDDLPF